MLVINSTNTSPSRVVKNGIDRHFFESDAFLLKILHYFSLFGVTCSDQKGRFMPDFSYLGIVHPCQPCFEQV
jgi:hypothetical protein